MSSFNQDRNEIAATLSRLAAVLLEYSQKNAKLGIFPHARADGDALGAALSLTLALQQLGADPGTATPAGWAEQRAGMLVSAGSTAQPMTREQAEQERGRLLWVAVAKILGALIAAGAGLAIGIALLAGMAG